MDQALSNALTYCPEYNISTLIIETYNVTAFQNPAAELPQFICYCLKVSELSTSEYWWCAYIKLATICLGLPSSILALILFSSKPFKTVSFTYHRAINALELICILFLSEPMFIWFLGDQFMKSTALIQYEQYIAGGKLDFALPMAIKIIVAWVALERACMCNYPFWFTRINKKSVAFSTITGSIVFSVVVIVPVWWEGTYEWDNGTEMYVWVKSPMVTSPGYLEYMHCLGSLPLVQFVILTVTSAMTVYGLWSMSKNKKRLLASAGHESVSGKNLIQQIAMNKEYCILQICEAFPVIASCTFFGYLFIGGTPDQELEELVQMEYGEAMAWVWAKKTASHIKMCAAVADAVAHGTHFYRYMLFSQKCRHVVLDFLRKTKVRPI